MKPRIRLNQSSLKRSLRQLAAQSKKSRRELSFEATRGFVKEIIQITPPGSPTTRGSAALKAGQRAIMRDLARIMVATRKRSGVQLHDPASVHKRLRDSRTGRTNPRNLHRPYPVDGSALMAYQKELFLKIGVLAGGWNAAAEKLGVKVPEWIARHGTGRSVAVVIQSRGETRMKISNRVKFLKNVEHYQTRIQMAVNNQAGKMRRHAQFLLTRNLQRAGWK